MAIARIATIRRPAGRAPQARPRPPDMIDRRPCRAFKRGTRRLRFRIWRPQLRENPSPREPHTLPDLGGAFDGHHRGAGGSSGRDRRLPVAACCGRCRIHPRARRLEAGADGTGEGPIAVVNYAGIAFFILVGLAVAITGSGALTSVAEPLGDALRIAGILVLWVAGLLAVWGIRTMGRHLVSPAEVRPDTELVTTGPFGLVRHPMYLSILLLWAGGALALLGWVLAVGFVLLVPAFYLRARTEEGLLTRHFGDAYTAYAARVPMLLPGLRRGLAASARVRGRASGFAATDRRPLRPERGPAATQRWPRPLGPSRSLSVLWHIHMPAACPGWKGGRKQKSRIDPHQDRSCLLTSKPGERSGRPWDQRRPKARRRPTRLSYTTMTMSAQPRQR